MSGDELNPLVSDPAIVQAYNEVRKPNSSTNWVVLKYNDNRSKLQVEGTGSGGVEEAKSHLTEDSVKFAYFKLAFDADDGTKRTKFYLLTWAGPDAKPLVKGKLSVHKPIVKSVFKEAARE